MELKDLINNLKKYRNSVLVLMLLGGLVGVLSFYIFVPKFYAVGTIFVSHESEFNKKPDFTYEGYYGQQTARNYAKTLIGILESVDVRKDALSKIGTPVNETTLRQAKKAVSVKESAPQIVTVSVKDKDQGRAMNYWSDLVAISLSTSDKLNADTGNSVKLEVLSGAPVVYRQFHSIWFNIGLGVVLGFFVSWLAILFKEYLSK